MNQFTAYCFQFMKAEDLQSSIGSKDTPLACKNFNSDENTCLRAPQRAPPPKPTMWRSHFFLRCRYVCPSSMYDFHIHRKERKQLGISKCFVGFAASVVQTSARRGPQGFDSFRLQSHLFQHVPALVCAKAKAEDTEDFSLFKAEKIEKYLV